MKIFIALFTLFFISNTYAATLKIYGACLNRPFLKEKVRANSTVAQITADVLTKHHIRFETSEGSMIYMLGLSSQDVIETSYQDSSLGEQDMRIYGWCYAVNGTVPSKLANEYVVKTHDTVEWFYGYVLYSNGQWGEMCQRAYELAPIFLCGE